ncbi:hypothetical protein [Microvirga solisilvae]|uniref:hypothetical protein n=1 Tax=Microvirga solisilvae TaxID=2919498 RepID=UPI001FAFE2D0|nr:hypothetical protein [Microvirga solisilvae]
MDLLAGNGCAPCIVQPQPKASAGSVALGFAQLCVCEVIEGDDTLECGNGEAALVVHNHG